MKKTVIKILLLSSAVSFAKVNLGVQTGITHGGYSIGFGGSVFATSQTSEKFSFGAKLGYYTLGKETITDPNAIYPFIKTKSDLFLQMVGDYYIIKKKKISPFVGLGMGVHFYGNSFGNSSSLMLLFGLSPTVGFEYVLSKKVSIRLSYIYSLLFTAGKKRNDIFNSSNLSVYSSPSILKDHYGQFNLGVVFEF